MWENGTGSEFFLAPLEEGESYQVSLSPGVYTVRLAVSGRRSFVLEEALEIDGSEGRLDLMIPGATVRGRVIPWMASRGSGEGERPESLELTRSPLPADRSASSGPGKTRLAPSVTPEGSFQFEGVGEGRWVLTGGILAESPVEISVEPGQVALSLEVLGAQGDRRGER